MKSIIEEYFMYRDEDAKIRTTEEYKKARDFSAEKYDNLPENFTKEQKTKIDELFNALSDEVSEAAASYYREGFKEGFKLACEIYGITEPEDR
jgi:hypothetical protein